MAPGLDDGSPCQEIAQPGRLGVVLPVAGRPTVTDRGVVEFRAVHRGIGEATVRVWGRVDLPDLLDHGFHPGGCEVRCSIGPAARREIHEARVAQDEGILS